VKYAFIRDHRSVFSIRAMCRVFKVHFSGFYAWLEKPLSNRVIEDQRLLTLIRQFYIASGATYGSPWIHRDMREAGETCSVHRVARIMRENKLKAQIGYKRRYIKGGKLANVAANVLDRNFNPDEPNLEPSMSHRGNCHDNAVAESFFATFKKRVTQRKIYSPREEAYFARLEGV
jgi:putative transposase